MVESMKYLAPANGNDPRMAAERDEELINNKNLRDMLVNRAEVLDTVKALFVIPGLDMVNVQQVAGYFGVGTSTIRTLYMNNKGELDGDGTKKLGRLEVSSHLSTELTDEKTQRTSTVALANGDRVVIANPKTVYFTRRAVLRIAMLLRNSLIAKEIRTQLLNAFEQASPEQKTAAIDEERDIILRIGMADVMGDHEAQVAAMAELIRFHGRYREAAEKKVAELIKTNAALDAENDMLAARETAIAPRQLLNKMIRKISYEREHGQFGVTWNRYHKRLYYRHSINLKARSKTSGEKSLGCLRDEEWPLAIATAAAMCRKTNLDMEEFLTDEDIRMVLEAERVAEPTVNSDAEQQRLEYAYDVELYSAARAG